MGTGAFDLFYLTATCDTYCHPLSVPATQDQLVSAGDFCWNLTNYSIFDTNGKVSAHILVWSVKSLITP